MLAAHGLSVRPPSGWDVRIYRRAAAPGESTHPILHASTVRLPWVRGDYGSNVVDRLGAADAFVALVEFGDGAAAAGLFEAEGVPRPRPGDFHPRQLHRVLPRQSGAQWFFHVGDRAFSLYVVLGEHAQRLLVVRRIREVLDTVDVGAAR